MQNVVKMLLPLALLSLPYSPLIPSPFPAMYKPLQAGQQLLAYKLFFSLANF